MKPYLFVLLGAVSVSACAQPPATAPAPAQSGAQAGKTDAPTAMPGTPAERARAAILQVNPKVEIDQIGAAPLPGFQEVVVGGQVVYVSDDGKYLLQGALYDIAAKKNVGDASLARVRRQLLQTVPVSDRIVFAPPNPVHTVSVFTDVECGYCRKFHSEIAEYNRRGIAVEYLAFPRMGPASEGFRKMISVWCAPDRRKALTDAKLDKPIPMRDCKTPVAMQYALGQRVGLTGTPMILASDGSQLGGYLPPAELRAALDKLAAAPAAAAGAGAN